MIALGGAGEEGLVARYPLDAVSADTVYDTGSHKLNGTVIGAEWAKGDFGTALQFKGPETYVECGPGSTLGLKNTLTLSVWMKADKVPEGEAVLIGEGTNTYAITYYKNRRAYFYINSGGNYTRVHVPLEERVHLVATFDGKALKLYFNGELKGTKEIEEVAQIATKSNLVIGRGTSAKYGYYGAIDDARIYNRVLSEDEIKALYTKGTK